MSHKYVEGIAGLPWARILRIGVAILLIAVLYRQLFVLNDFGRLWEGFRQNQSQSPLWQLLLVIFLMPVNLILEAQKFRMLFATERRPGIMLAMKSVLSGLVLGLITPNRVGEYVGRLIEHRARLRTVAFFSTVIGGLAQWTIMLLSGAFALAVLRYQGSLKSMFASYPELETWAEWLWILALLAGMSLLWVLAKARNLLPHLMKLLRTPKPGETTLQAENASFWKQNWERLRTHLGIKSEWLEEGIDLSQSQVWKVFGLACLRYTVYIAQFSLAYQYFGLKIELFEIALGTAILLLIQSFIPLPSSLQALARIELALLIWAYANPNEVSMTVVSMFIFVLNLALPALVGMINLVQSNDETAIHPS